MLDTFDPRLDADFPAVDPAILRARLEPILPAGGFLTRLEAIRPYESDGLPAYRALPAAVALLPHAQEAREEVVQAVLVAAQGRPALLGLSDGRRFRGVRGAPHAAFLFLPHPSSPV
jgi:glycolate oxidase